MNVDTQRHSASAPSDRAMMLGRRIELDQISAPPAGLEVHRTKVVHEAQAGDGLLAIARDYGNAFGLRITTADLTAANSTALRDGLQAGELLTIPGVAAALDSAFLSDNRALEQVNGKLRHVTGKRTSLAKIAKHYRQDEGLKITAKDILADNRKRVSDPDRVAAGTALRIPGITHKDPSVTNRSMKKMDGKQLLTLTSRIQSEAGTVSTVPTQYYTANRARAERMGGGTASDALGYAGSLLQSNDRDSSVYAVVQAKNGAFWVVPMKGRESGNGDDSTTTLSLAMRSDSKEVVGVARLSGGVVTERRFDR